MSRTKKSPGMLSHRTPEQRAAIGIVVAWSLAWKGASLWRAARDDSRPWFIALLLVNSAGLLDAIYLVLVSPRRKA